MRCRERQELKATKVIAIDGPSASGKGSTSRELARRLGYLHVDTGAMYRALTWHCQRLGVIPADTEGREFTAAESAAVARICGEWPVRLVADGGHLRVAVAGHLPDEELRGPVVTSYVARVSHVPEVRAWMLDFQRGCAEFGSLVMDGRDIGTRIFPGTPFKFFLTAREEVRKARGENEGHGGGVARRDSIDQDLNQPAADAVLVDTSDRSVAAVADWVLGLIRERERRGDAAVATG